MIRRPPRSTLSSSSAASDVYKRQPCHGFIQTICAHGDDNDEGAHQGGQVDRMRAAPRPLYHALLKIGCGGQKWPRNASDRSAKASYEKHAVNDLSCLYEGGKSIMKVGGRIVGEGAGAPTCRVLASRQHSIVMCLFACRLHRNPDHRQSSLVAVLCITITKLLLLRSRLIVRLHSTFTS